MEFSELSNEAKILFVIMPNTAGDYWKLRLTWSGITGLDEETWERARNEVVCFIKAAQQAQKEFYGQRAKDFQRMRRLI